MRFKKFYCGGATKRERSKIHKLRVNPKRRNDIKGYRRILGILEQGYGRREARKQLGRFAQAHLELEHDDEREAHFGQVFQEIVDTCLELEEDERKTYLDQSCLKLMRVFSKGVNKTKIAEAGAWLFIIRCAQRLADDYRLRENYPAPLTLAFEDLIYKRPKPEPSLRGYFTTKDGGEPTVLLEDAQKKAPEVIARVVKYRLRGDDNKVVRQIRIFNRHSNWGEWEFRQIR